MTKIKTNSNQIQSSKHSVIEEKKSKGSVKISGGRKVAIFQAVKNLWNYLVDKIKKAIDFICGRKIELSDKNEPLLGTNQQNTSEKPQDDLINITEFVVKEENYESSSLEFDNFDVKEEDYKSSSLELDAFHVKEEDYKSSSLELDNFDLKEKDYTPNNKSKKQKKDKK